MNYECRKYNGGFIFQIPVIADYGKTTQKCLDFLQEKGKIRIHHLHTEK